MTTPAAPLCQRGHANSAHISAGGCVANVGWCTCQSYAPPPAVETREAEPRKHEHTYACAAADCEAVVGPAAEPAGGQEKENPFRNQHLCHDPSCGRRP